MIGAKMEYTRSPQFIDTLFSVLVSAIKWKARAEGGVGCRVGEVAVKGRGHSKQSVHYYPAPRGGG